jgi:hypothetical protein
MFAVLASAKKLIIGPHRVHDHWYRFFLNILGPTLIDSNEV